MSNGSLKLIQNVEIGEELIGKDGLVNKVIEFHRPKLGDMDDIAPHKQRMVSINNGGFDTSEDHMFYTTDDDADNWKAPNAESCKIIHKKVLEEEGVINMQDLQIGDHIITPNGTIKVESIEFKEDDPDLPLYNFILDGNKTYHVIMEGHDEPLLVHNKICFASDTQILLATGKTQTIDTITPDTEIFAFDIEGNFIVRKVGFIDNHTVDCYTEIKTQTRELKATMEHPIYVGEGCFTFISSLQKGDFIYIQDNNNKLKKEMVIETTKVSKVLLFIQ